MPRWSLPAALSTVALCVAAGCGDDEAPGRAGLTPLRVSADDEVGDVERVPGGAADAERLDLDQVTVERDGPVLSVTFDTVEQPGEDQVRRFYAWSLSGDRNSLIEAVAGEEGVLRGYHRPPGGPRQQVQARQRGSLVTVTARLDAVTAARSFRWQARTLETRLDPSIADRVPGSGRLRFPSAR